MKYLLDSNIFIEAKNHYYSFDICPGFWDWIDSSCVGDVHSIVNVRDELIIGGDDLADWIKARKDEAWFLKVDDPATQTNFRAVANHVASQTYTPAAQAKFLAKADPWLIAKAMTIGATVVTHEGIAAGAKARVPIPNVCGVFGVPCMNTFDALRQFSASFRLR